MSEGAQQRLRVEPDVLDRYPAYRGFVIYARGISNGPSDARTRGLLEDAAARARDSFGETRASADPHVAAWRETFSSFGAKPSRYPSSLEALLGRVLRTGELPSVNRLVDIYNVVSVTRALPIGGEDLDQLRGDGVLRFARGDEEFVVFHGGAEDASTPREGEVIWADDEGVTCRRWNWRQCRRTQLTDDSTAAYFLLEAIGDYPDEELAAATSELGERILELCPEAELEATPLTRA